MNKTKAKVFTIFWFVSGLVWTFVSIKRFLGGEDMVVLYTITALGAFVLAFVFFKQR